MVDITYIDNIVDALILCINSDNNTFGQKYNITNDDPIILYEFLKEFITRLGYKFNPKIISFRWAYTLALFLEFLSKNLMFHKEPKLTLYSVGLLTYSKTLDISKAKKELGYYPKVGIEEGVNKVIEFWKKNNDRKN